MVGKQPLILPTVRSFAEAVRQQGIPLRHVILFGSHANGTEREWSDVDVALVADEFVGVPFEDIRRFIDVAIQPPFICFEYHTFNTADFENGDPFVAEIRRTGIEVC